MDAKSLLRAKKAGARIDHPYASYASGQLKCSICAVPVQQWDAHLLTKQHRASVSREKATQAKASSKRPAEESAGQGAKRSKVDPATLAASSSILPAGFFDNADARPVDTIEQEEENPAPAPAPTASSSVPGTTSAPSQPSAPKPTGDSELDAFLSSLAEPEPEPAPESVDLPTTSRPRPRITSPSLDLGVASYSAAPIRNVPEPTKAQEEEPEPEETEAEKRARLVREEKEEIMERLEAEQRAQEDADGRVQALKARMEMLKAKRKARAPKDKAAKS